MTTETEQNMNQAIDWLQTTTGQIQDFASEQAPLYCQEVIRFAIFDGIIGIAFGLALSGLGFYLFRRCRAVASSRDPMMCAPIGAAAFIVTVLGLVSLFIGGSTVLKAFIAPRVLIVEHFRGLK